MEEAARVGRVTRAGLIFGRAVGVVIRGARDTLRNWELLDEPRADDEPPPLSSSLSSSLDIEWLSTIASKAPVCA